MIINPVFIEKGVVVQNSIIGPFVSISKDANIKNSIIKNSIISERATIEDSQMKNSIIGVNACVKGTYNKLNVGDDSELIFEGNGNNS